MYILGIDPGRTTGFALYDTDKDQFVATGEFLTDVSQPLLLTMYAHFLRNNFHPLVDYVVLEETLIKGQRAGDGKHDQIAADAITLMLFGDRADCLRFVKPEARKTAPTTAGLEIVNGTHAKDAARLVIAWYSRHK